MIAVVRSRRLARVAALLGGLLAALAAASAWLAAEDAVERCPAIAVLNGDHPARVDEAVRLRNDDARVVMWLTSDPHSAGAETADAGTASNVRRLRARGISPDGVVVLPGEARGTRAELEILRVEALRREFPCVVVVTSPWHGPRVKATWLRMDAPRPRLIVRHAPAAGYGGWWSAAVEIAGTAAALTGLR
jgi:hypothetical protein